MNRIRVVGLGNAWAGNDAVGLVAAERFQRQAPAGIEVLQMETPDWQMFEGIEAEDYLLVIDACLDESPPGTVHELGIENLASLPLRHCSSHGLGLADWLAMAEAMGEETGCLHLYAVSIGQAALGEPLSAEMEQAIERLLPMLKRKISALQGRSSHA